jgi:hypothetical protein
VVGRYFIYQFWIWWWIVINLLYLICFFSIFIGGWWIVRGFLVVGYFCWFLVGRCIISFIFILIIFSWLGFYWIDWYRVFYYLILMRGDCFMWFEVCWRVIVKNMLVGFGMDVQLWRWFEFLMRGMRRTLVLFFRNLLIVLLKLEDLFSNHISIHSFIFIFNRYHNN